MRYFKDNNNVRQLKRYVIYFDLIDRQLEIGIIGIGIVGNDKTSRFSQT